MMNSQVHMVRFSNFSFALICPFLAVFIHSSQSAYHLSCFLFIQFMEMNQICDGVIQKRKLIKKKCPLSFLWGDLAIVSSFRRHKPGRKLFNAAANREALIEVCWGKRRNWVIILRVLVSRGKFSAAFFSPKDQQNHLSAL